ncbi:helix-turn-helix transcriptional regulator, partial [Nocardia cyriacigeorgica]|nr:helix-turn-helix transcriptional regulator [Nocardia cyriacigeorgica]
MPTFDKPDRIRKALQVAGVGVAEMAEYVGVTRETMSRYMSGKQDAPLAIVRLVAMRTGVPFGWIQTGSAPSNVDGADAVRPKGFEPLTF